MESGPESLQPVEHGVATGPVPETGSPQEGRQDTRLSAGDGPGVWAAESSGGNGQGAAGAGASLRDAGTDSSSPPAREPCSPRPRGDWR